MEVYFDYKAENIIIPEEMSEYLGNPPAVHILYKHDGTYIMIKADDEESVDRNLCVLVKYSRKVYSDGYYMLPCRELLTLLKKSNRWSENLYVAFEMVVVPGAVIVNVQNASPLIRAD